MTKGADTRQTILRKGVEAAYRVGLGGLTIGHLATATGMSKSGLFAHFRSKELLQMEVLREARAEFIDSVIRPALATPRGEPRVRELFERWIACGRARMPGGCLFVKAAAELDEQDGPIRDQLVREHLDLYDAIARMFGTGIAEGHFHQDADPMQFAADLDGVMLAYYHAHRLLEDEHAEARARYSFERLIAGARTPPDPQALAAARPAALSSAAAPSSPAAPSSAVTPSSAAPNSSAPSGSRVAAAARTSDPHHRS